MLYAMNRMDRGRRDDEVAPNAARRSGDEDLCWELAEAIYRVGPSSAREEVSKPSKAASQSSGFNEFSNRVRVDRIRQVTDLRVRNQFIPAASDYPVTNFADGRPNRARR